MNISELKTHGRVYVAYPEALRDAVEKAMVSWKAFCALPNEIKLRFGYDADAKVSGNGYELKDVPGKFLDRKEDFHLRVSAKNELLQRANQVDEIITPQFVKDALALNPFMAPLLREFGEAVEKECDMPGFAEDVMGMQDSWLFRFLHYFGNQEPGSEIAAGHVDKGGFTLHLYESHAGVERLTYETRVWEPMPLSHKETVIIPGTGLQNRSKGQLKGLCHRVVATEETANNGRYSAVCFFDFAHRRYYDKATHGRLQDWPCGFNYDMAHEEFDKLFID